LGGKRTKIFSDFPENLATSITGKRNMTADEEIATVLEAVDTLALALSGYRHQWTERERQAYETAVRLLTFGDYTEIGSSASPSSQAPLLLRRWHPHCGRA
jgi:hypothetical protein